jgi:hypothetical protein
MLEEIRVIIFVWTPHSNYPLIGIIAHDKQESPPENNPSAWRYWSRIYELTIDTTWIWCTCDIIITWYTTEK